MRRRSIVLLAAAAVLLAAGGGVALWLATRPADPADTARAYLGALQRGDGRAALDLVAGGADAHPGAREALAGATGLLSDATVTDVRATGATATVRAQAVLAGARRELAFSLRREGAGWVVDDDALGIAEIVPTLGEVVQIGGARVDAGAVALLPGGYPVAGAPTGLVTGSAEVLVLPGETTRVDVETRLSPEALTAAQEQLDAYAAACTTGGDAVPAACGLRIPWPADLAAATAFAYRVERLPAVRLSEDATAFVADGGAVVATVTGTTRAGQAATVTYRTDAWTLRGTVRLDGDGLTLAVR